MEINNITKPSDILDEKDRAMALPTDFLFDMKLQLIYAGFGERHILQADLHGKKWQEFYTKTNDKMNADNHIDSNLVLLGARGTGKTQLACELARNNYFGFMKAEYDKIVGEGESLSSKHDKYKAVSECNPVTYTTWFTFWLDYVTSIHEDGGSAKLIEKMETVALLVIDELHRLKVDTAKELIMLEHILDTRYLNNKSTIIISNFDTKEELHELVGQTIAHRMQESYQVLNFNNIESYR